MSKRTDEQIKADELARAMKDLDRAKAELLDELTPGSENDPVIQLTAYADGHFQVEFWKPAKEAIAVLTLALSEMIAHYDELEQKGQEAGNG